MEHYHAHTKINKKPTEGHTLRGCLQMDFGKINHEHHFDVGGGVEDLLKINGDCIDSVECNAGKKQ